MNPLVASLAAPALALAAAAILAPHATAGVPFVSVVAEAAPDECFNGLGAPYVPYDGGCAPGELPKRNQTYAWSLTSLGDDVWIGTGANISCIGAAAAGAPPIFVPFTFVCESDLSQYPGVPAFLRLPYGDWRPPQVVVHDASLGTEVDVTPPSLLVRGTMGFRAAGTRNGLVLLAGPRLVGFGVNWFLFDGASRTFLRAWTTVEYSNVRKMVSHGGELYIAVQNTLGGGGSVLRFNGIPSSAGFEVVGQIDGDGANLAVHQGRLFCATWAATEQSSLIGLLNLIGGDVAPSGIWMSPLIPPGGLTAFHRFFWRKVFSVDDYEPDPVIAGAYLVGDLCSFGEYLYFGTMHPPTASYRAFVSAYGEPDPGDVETFQDLAFRRSSVLRLSDFSLFSDPDVELLYGETEFPVYDENLGDWVAQPNLLGQAPLYGAAGLGNPDNVYFWVCAVLGGKLYVGTLDYPSDQPDLLPGADLFRFPDTSSPAETVDADGLGNSQNVGYRSILVKDDALYLGTANPSNIHPLGGWKLLRLTEGL